MNHNRKKNIINFLKGYICQRFYKTTIPPKSAASVGIIEAVAFLAAQSWKLVAQ
jgi:hypothetical protein